jgi:hypothetical protein
MRATSFFTVLLLPLAVACGGSGGSSGATTPAQLAQQAARDAAGVNERLRGNWRLADYRPEVPLEATFQMLLTAQIQTMVIRFENGRLLADSPTIHLNRSYEITEVAGKSFKMTSRDDAGVAIVSSCQFSDDGTQVFFRGDTAPWRGIGTIRQDR